MPPVLISQAVIDVDLQAKMEAVVAECPQATKGCDWRGHVTDVDVCIVYLVIILVFKYIPLLYSVILW